MVVQLSHEAWGEERGTPLLLLHGFPFSRALWERSLPALSKSVRAVAPDLRGFGASPPGPDGAAIEDYARDVLALADRLGLDEFDVAGHSMGGYVALALAPLSRGRLRRLALVCTRASADSDAAKAIREKHVEIVEKRGVDALVDDLLPKLLAPGAGEVLREEARRATQAASVTGAVHALRAMAARPDATPVLGTLDVPALVLAGAEDQVMPRAEQERTAEALPKARFETIPGAGHLPMLETPEAFVDTLAAFIR